MFQGSSPSHNHIRCSASSLSAAITSRFAFTSTSYRGCANLPRYLSQRSQPGNDRSPQQRAPEGKAEAPLPETKKTCQDTASSMTFVGTLETAGQLCRVKQTHDTYLVVYTNARQFVMYVAIAAPLCPPIVRRRDANPCSTALQPSFDNRQQRMARWLHPARLPCGWR